jgi:hypothetical protein
MLFFFFSVQLSSLVSKLLCHPVRWWLPLSVVNVLLGVQDQFVE